MVPASRRRLAARTVIGLVLVTVARSGNGADSCRPSDLGCAIFTGQHSIAAHLRGDDRLLPAETARCINCHVQTGAAPAFAPPLSRSYLLDPSSRRGGPPSHYDQAVFCRVLTNGVDPAGIVLKKSMPYYALSGAECAALWQFLINQRLLAKRRVQAE
jgi:hypothetical protein